MNLSKGSFLSEFTKSIVRPLIKKETLDPDELSNYRPISNLSFLSKTLERIVASQIDEYLHDNGLYARMQSAYRKYHSTETALIRVVNDIRRAINAQCESVLVLLDLSAAFDTIDQEILLERLRFRYGFSNLVLQWFTSYLIDRPQRIVLDKFSSQPRRLSCGVPQGSVLGPVLFSLYISPLEDVIMAHGLNAMMYADDSQLNIIMRQSYRATALEDLTLCIQDIMSWNVSNMLKCNPKKTEIIHFSSRFSLANPIPSIKVGDCSITPSNEVKDLGVTLDRHLTLKTHINNICRSASRSIHQIGKIRNFLSRSATERLIHAFVSSKLDYCNSILLGLSSYELEKLQRLQNTAARLTVTTKKSAHVTQVLKSLYWLPVKERIIFKILLVTYKILHGFAPAYLNELLLNYTPHRLLRSSSLNLLSIPKTKSVTYGDRSFSVIAPNLWNDLTIIIKQCSTVDSFKLRLKTFLFNSVYS